jgi:DNA polymerase theta
MTVGANPLALFWDSDEGDDCDEDHCRDVEVQRVLNYHGAGGRADGEYGLGDRSAGRRMHADKVAERGHRVEWGDDESGDELPLGSPVECGRAEDSLDLNSNSVANFVPHGGILRCMRSCGCPMELYDWQTACLHTPGVLDGRSNLVYCAPTSGGKSMVAELLMLRRVLDTGKSALLVLPYVSICTEKANHFKNMFADLTASVGGETGPPITVVELYGSLQGVDVLDRLRGPAIIVSTIEKANILVNKWVEEGGGKKGVLEKWLSAMVIDELHMVGDAQRGYLLELMLTKLRYLNTSTQIIGMSATISKVEIVAHWLNAKLYLTEYRPVPLQEYFVQGDRVTLPDKKFVKTLNTELGGSRATDLDSVTALVAESLSQGHSVIIFCSSRRSCQQTAEFLIQRLGARGLGNHEKGNNHTPSRQSIAEELQLHQNSPAVKSPPAFHLDSVQALHSGTSLPSSFEKTPLQISIEHGISWHHAGLDSEERMLVEKAFKSGSISVLCATSTLAAGVNLPARRVIIRQPYIAGDKKNLLEPSKYKQMIGRAGRAGFDVSGESFLIGGNGIPDDKLYRLMNIGIEPISSGLETCKNDLHRSLLEVITSGCVSEPAQVQAYVESTLLFQLAKADDKKRQAVLDQAQVALNELYAQGYIYWTLTDGRGVWKPTNTGIAVHSSGLPPDVCRNIVGDLEKAQKAFVLDSDLHLIYLCVPLNEDTNVDWEKLAKLMNRMDQTSASVVREGRRQQRVRRQPTAGYSNEEAQQRNRPRTHLPEILDGPHSARCHRGDSLVPDS